MTNPRRTYAIVCVDCGRDLVYVNVVREQGRRVLDNWASRWFGCDCIGRPRLVRYDTWWIVADGHGPHERLEPWTRLFRPRWMPKGEQ